MSTNRPLRRLLTGAALLGVAALTLAGTAGPASADVGHDGVTEQICHTDGLYLRSQASPTGHAIDHLENGWHFVVGHHADNNMLWGYSPRLNRSGYVLDGYFC